MPQMQCADRGQNFGNNTIDLSRRESEVERAEGDVIADARHKKLVVRILKCHSDGPTHFCKRLSPYHILADADTPLARGQVAVQMEQQGGLARSVPADERDRFAVGNTERHLLQGCGAVGVAVA